MLHTPVRTAVAIFTWKYTRTSRLMKKHSTPSTRDRPEPMSLEAPRAMREVNRSWTAC